MIEGSRRGDVLQRCCQTVGPDRGAFVCCCVPHDRPLPKSLTPQRTRTVCRSYGLRRSWTTIPLARIRSPHAVDGSLGHRVMCAKSIHAKGNSPLCSSPSESMCSVEAPHFSPRDACTSGRKATGACSLLGKLRPSGAGDGPSYATANPTSYSPTGPRHHCAAP